jgi:hypothetical protein
MGDSEAIFRNQSRLRGTAGKVMRRGAIPQDNGWNGWLGHHQGAPRAAAIDLERQDSKERERHGNRDLRR